MLGVECEGCFFDGGRGEGVGAVAGAAAAERHVLGVGGGGFVD